MQFSPHFAEQDEEFEEVPSEFDLVPPVPPAHHDTPQFSSNLTQRKACNPLTPKRMSNENFFQKSSQYLNNKRLKLGSLKAEIDHRAMADCTFKPSINRSNGKNPRNLKQFLDSQANHQAKINEKTNNLKQRIEDENQRLMTFSPQINKTKFVKHRDNDTVHERLYKLKDKERDLPIVTYDHTPKITEKGERLVRNMPGFELLYEDARRRADKYHNQKVEPIETTRQRNGNIEKFAAQKFLKDYKATLTTLSLQEKQTFDQQDFQAILRGLGYTIYNQEQSTPLAEDEHLLIKEAFTFLQKSGVTQANLFVFLLAVGGIYDIQLGDKTSIDEQEGRKIHSYFDCLFRNRLLNDSKKLGRTPPRQQSPFKPTINPDSTNLAEKYRNKMIERANNIFAKNSIDIQIPDKGLAHEDLLVIYNLGQNLQKQKMREQKKQQKDPECTFQPNSEKYSHEIHSQDAGAEKCHDLYEQAKARQAEINKISTMPSFFEEEQAKRRDISPKASKIHKNSIPHPKSNIKSYLDIKDVDKTLARMVMGRQIRNQKRQYQERGQKINQKHSSTKRASDCASRQREVLFDVDVSINGVNKKIFIYSEDRYRIPEVVAEFSQECGLDAASQKTLEEQLLEAVADLPEGLDLLP